MESHVLAVPVNVRMARSPSRVRCARDKKRELGLLVVAINSVRDGIAAAVVRGSIALAAEVQHILWAVVADESGTFDKWTICVVTVEDAAGWAGGSEPVVLDLLQDDPGVSLRFVSVVALAAVADGVAVDFVEEVAFAVCVAESASIDGAAFISRASHWRVRD